MSEVISYHELEGGGDKSPTTQYTDSMHNGEFGGDFKTAEDLGATNVQELAEQSDMTVEQTRNQINSRIKSNDSLVRGGARIGYIKDETGDRAGEVRPFFEVTQRQENAAKREMKKAQKDKLDEMIAQERVDKEAKETETKGEKSKSGEILSEEIKKVLTEIAPKGAKSLEAKLEQISNDPDKFAEDMIDAKKMKKVLLAIQILVRSHVEDEGASTEIRITLEWINDTVATIDKILEEEGKKETEEDEDEEPIVPPVQPVTPPNANEDGEDNEDEETEEDEDEEPVVPPVQPIPPQNGGDNGENNIPEANNGAELAERWQDVDIRRREYLEIERRKARLTTLYWTTEEQRELVAARESYNEAFTIAVNLKAGIFEREERARLGVQNRRITPIPRPNRENGESDEDYTARVRSWEDETTNQERLEGTPEQKRAIEQAVFGEILRLQSVEEQNVANEMARMDKLRFIDRVSNFIRRHPAVVTVAAIGLVGVATTGAFTVPALFVGVRAASSAIFGGLATSSILERRYRRGEDELRKRTRRDTVGSRQNLEQLERRNDEIREENRVIESNNTRIRREIEDLQSANTQSQEALQLAQTERDRVNESNRLIREENERRVENGEDELPLERFDISTIQIPQNEIRDRNAEIQRRQRQIRELREIPEIEYSETPIGGIDLTTLSDRASAQIAFNARRGSELDDGVGPIRAEDAEDSISYQETIDMLQDQRTEHLAQRYMYERSQRPDDSFEDIVTRVLTDGTGRSYSDRLVAIEDRKDREKYIARRNSLISLIAGGALGGATGILSGFSTARM